LTGSGAVVGSNLCIDYSLNANGQISNGGLSASAATALHVCGPVSTITSPTGANTGSVTIAGQTIQLAPGAALAGAPLHVGSTLCLDAGTNPQGQITNGNISTSAPTALNLCGVVSAFAPPTNASAGSLTVAGQTIVLAPGTAFTGGSATAGRSLCGNFTTNPQGAITGGAITASLPTTLNLCGLVGAVVLPSAVNVGSLTIGGQTIQIGPGTNLSGAGLVAGTNLCAVLNTNPQGQVSGGTVSLAAPTALNVCGVVGAFIPPTTANVGGLTIGGQTVVLAPGTALSGGSLGVGRELCGAFTTNPQGQVSGGRITASAPTSLTLCGLVDGFLAPTSAAPGSISIAGQTLSLASGTVLEGVAPAAGTNLCGIFATNPQGQVTGGTISASVPSSLSICGVVGTFVPPTSAALGRLTIAGQTLDLAPGTTLGGLAAQAGTNVCGALTTNPGGQINGGTLTAGIPTTATVCGIVTSYLPPVQSTPGSITVGATVLVLPPGTSFPSGFVLGHNACVQQTGSGGSGGPGGSSGGTTGFAPGSGSKTGSGSGSGSGAGTGSASGSGSGLGSGSGSGSSSGSGSGNGSGSNGRASSARLLEYALPHGAGPWHLEWDGHHNLWFSELRRGRLAELVAGTRTLREFPLRSRTSRPHGLAIDRSGAVWVAESGANRIGRLQPHGQRATLTQWVLPHRNSDPEHVALAVDGTVWVTEDSNRIAHLNPRTGRFDEYTAARNAYPHGIQMGARGPIFVDENAGAVTQVTIGSDHRARFATAKLPRAMAHPEELLVTRAGISITEQATGAFVRLDTHTIQRRNVRPESFRLRAHAVQVRVVRSGLPIYRFNVKARVSRLATQRRQHSTAYMLPHRRSQPYDLRLLKTSARVWLTEDRGNRVALLQLPRKRILEYPLPQRNSAPKGLEIRTSRHGTQVWIAAYGIDRLLMLSAP